MHKANIEFWKQIEEKFNDFFKESIIEFGSYDINGSIRNIIGCNAEEYIGLDWRAGPSVDVVSLAHEYSPERKFKAIVSASMLEHDPYWKDSLSNMAELLDDEGIMVLSWGTALNPSHCLKEAPDGKFHSLKAGLVIDHLKNLGMNIHSFLYEANLPNYDGPQLRILEEFQRKYPAGYGSVGLVAFHASTHGVDQIDELIEEDVK
jgi:hypothetical protein